jgi:hydrogenase maturation protease
MGIGNILLRDEGVGVRIIEAMGRLDLPQGVELVDAGTAGADLVEFIADREQVIVIDAIEADAAPGTVFRLRGDELLPEPGSSISLHQLGLVESLVMAEQMGCSPGEVIVFGIQPGEIRPGLELSPEVDLAIGKVVAAVREELATSPVLCQSWKSG